MTSFQPPYLQTTSCNLNFSAAAIKSNIRIRPTLSSLIQTRLLSDRFHVCYDSTKVNDSYSNRDSCHSKLTGAVQKSQKFVNLGHVEVVCKECDFHADRKGAKGIKAAYCSHLMKRSRRLRRQCGRRLFPSHTTRATDFELLCARCSRRISGSLGARSLHAVPSFSAISPNSLSLQLEVRLTPQTFVQSSILTHVDYLH